MIFIMLINVKMPTTFGILTFMNMIELESKNCFFLFFSILVFYEQLEVPAQLS